MKINILKATHIVPRHIACKYLVIAHSHTVQIHPFDWRMNILLVGVIHKSEIHV